MKNLFYLTAFAAFAVLIFTACDKNGDNGNDSGLTPEISVAQKVIAINSNSGSHKIEYTLTNAKESAVVSASTKSDWITIGECTPTSVTFNAESNNDGKSRAGFIVLSYKNANPVSVMVSQAKQENVDADMTFTITVSDISTTLATITVVPTTSSPYYFGITTKKEYDKHGKEAAIKGFIDYIKQDLEYYPDRTIDDYIVKGKQSYEFSPLWSDTEYCVVAFDLNKEFGYSGNVTTNVFTTEPTGISGNGFKIDVNGTKVTVTPQSTAKGKYYIMGVMDIYEWSAYPSSANYSGAFYAAFDYLSNITDMQSNLCTGTKTVDYAEKLNASTYDTFVAFAFGTNGTGVTGINPDIQGDVTFVKFEYEHAIPTSEAKEYTPTEGQLQNRCFVGRTSANK